MKNEKLREENVYNFFAHHFLRLRYNNGQNIVDKFTKLSKISVSWEYFTADLPQLSTITVEIWLLDACLGTCYQLKTFQGFS